MPSQVQDLDRILEVSGMRFRLREWGDADAPPVVVLHGLMGISAEWDPLAAALAPSYHVVAVDQRGHGRSDWSDDYSALAMVGDALGVIDELSLGCVRLVGHSMGGMVGMLLAADRPDLIDRLVVIDIGPESLTTQWGLVEIPVVLDVFARASYADPQEALDEWLAGDPLAQEDRLRHYVEHSLVPGPDGRYTWRFDAGGLSRFAASLTAADLWSAVDRIAAPTLLIRGELSELLARPVADEVMRRLPDGRLIEIPGAGHDLGVQAPEAVVAATVDFLGG